MRLSLISSTAIAALVANFAAGAAELSGKELKAAQKIYVVKCAKCHKLYEPTIYTDEEWGVWMQKMKKKSKLKDEQFNLLNSYTEMLRSNGPFPDTGKDGKQKR